MREGQGEALGLFVSCLAVIGFLLGFPGLSALLNGPLAFVLVAGTVIGAITFLMLTLRRQSSIIIGGIALLLFGSLAFGSTYGTMWYFMNYLPSTGGMDFSLMFETPTNARNEFMTEVKAGSFEKAYSLLSPDSQNQIPDVRTFQQIIKENNWQPVKWQWTTEKIESEHAEFEGAATFNDKRSGKIQLWLDKIDKHWKIASLNFQPQ